MFFASCQQEQFKQDVVIGEKVFTKEKLNSGHKIYQKYCQTCHGKDGKGDGNSAKGLFPPPRAFTRGKYKYSDRIDSLPPTDRFISQFIPKGFKGTGMIPMKLTVEEAALVFDYIKTFSPDTWKFKESDNQPFHLIDDPYKKSELNSAIDFGKKIFHGIAACFSCHPTPLNEREFLQIANNESFDFDPFISKKQKTDYGYEINPPNLATDELRSVTNLKSLTLRIALGVGGTTMAPYYEMLNQKELWALSHYINSLRLSDKKIK